MKIRISPSETTVLKCIDKVLLPYWSQERMNALTGEATERGQSWASQDCPFSPGLWLNAEGLVQTSFCLILRDVRSGRVMWGRRAFVASHAQKLCTLG